MSSADNNFIRSAKLKNKFFLKNKNVLVGQSRLAIDNRLNSDNKCYSCGLCIWGCPSNSIYTPLKTQLLLDSEKKGALILNGLDMFIYQGLASLDIWFGESISKKVNLNLIKEKLIEQLC